MDRGMTIDAERHRLGPCTRSIHWAGAIEFDPFDSKTAWVISGNGVYKTSDIDAPKSSWKFDVKGMEETGAYEAESIPGGKLVSIIGDYDGFMHTDPSQYVPRHTPSMGSTTGLAVAPQATHVMARVGKELYTSTNTGASWEKAPSKMARGATWRCRPTASCCCIARKIRPPLTARPISAPTGRRSPAWP
jgi:xyloglucan-specific exo-beta-1,4-glucanase